MENILIMVFAMTIAMAFVFGFITMLKSRK